MERDVSNGHVVSRVSMKAATGTLLMALKSTNSEIEFSCVISSMYSWNLHTNVFWSQKFSDLIDTG